MNDHYSRYFLKQGVKGEVNLLKNPASQVEECYLFCNLLQVGKCQHSAADTFLFFYIELQFLF